MTATKKILISGASGLIGTRLIEALRGNGHEVSTLVRRAALGVTEFEWDPYRGVVDGRALKPHARRSRKA